MCICHCVFVLHCTEIQVIVTYSHLAIFFFHSASPLLHLASSTHLLGTVLLLSSQVHALATVSLALFVVGFLGVGVVSLAVTETSHRTSEPLL